MKGKGGGGAYDQNFMVGFNSKTRPLFLKFN